jgi:4-hydroxy-tetrahydrodipicolinate reductase
MAIKVVISGYGRMGHMIESVLQRRGIEVAACSEDITATPKSLARECVCIDFTQPDAIRANYRFLAENFKATVIGTTGWNDIEDDVIAYFKKCGSTMIYASNFSIGVNILFKAAAYLSKLAAGCGDYKTTIEEIHHIHKLDAPSGTAISLGKIVDDAGGFSTPITSQRIGEVPGIHTLTLTGACDKITLSHEAFSREGLAQGAVEAALMTERVSGVYEFKDLLFNSEAL